MSALHCHRFLRLALAASLLSPALILAGCGMGIAAPAADSLATDGIVQGRAKGGEQPIVGATIQVYAVGTSGYGQGATLLATTTTGSNGNFSFNQVTTQTGASSTVNSTYGCPTPGSLLYLVASSGDPTGAGTATNYNSNIRLIDAIGTCSTAANTFYDINEVANVVSVAALQQFIGPISEGIGAPSTTPSSSQMSSAATGMANAFSLVASMLNYQYGTVNATYNPVSTAGVVTATPEVAKINTIANIIAACVDTTGSSSGACQSLLAAATPPQISTATNFSSSYSSPITATDTLLATLFMLQNPTDAGTQVTTCNGASTTSNLACLYSLGSGFAAFNGLAAQPTDWTVAITYASPSTQTVGGIVEGYLSFPQRLAIDKSGNVWVTNNETVANPATNVAGLTELSPTGGILQQVLTGPGVLVGPRTPTFDSAGNVWVPNFGNNAAANSFGYGKTVIEYTTTGAVKTYNVAGCPVWLAGDGNGNMFVGECSTSVNNLNGGNGTPGSDLEEITSGAASGTSGTLLNTTSTGYSMTMAGTIAVDSNYVVWVGTASSTVLAFPAYTGFAVSFTATDPGSLSVDSSNHIFVSNSGATASAAGVDKLSLSGYPYTITNASGAPYTGGGLTRAQLSVIDGSGNFWISVYPSNMPGYVVEFANTGAALSPVVGTTGGFIHTFHGPVGIAVDPSGNVWVGNNTNYTFAATAANGQAGGAAPGGFLTEIIGAAVPVVTPIAAGLPATAGGASYLGTPPQ